MQGWHLLALAGTPWLYNCFLEWSLTSLMPTGSPEKTLTGQCFHPSFACLAEQALTYPA